MKKQSRQNNIRTLGDIGEFSLLDSFVLPELRKGCEVANLGDDVSFVELLDNDISLVVTCDVGPKPLIWDLGHESYWSWGWYSVLANVSDLAAAGAKPIAYTSSVEAPNSLSSNQFCDFFKGMAAACSEFSIANAGGNIRTAPRFECHGTAIGVVPKDNKITRSGCIPGDTIIAVGHCGLFILSYLRAKSKGLSSLSEQDQNLLLKPKSQLNEMVILRKTALVHAASDNSDGLLGAVWNIAERSQCAVELYMDENIIPAEVLKVSEKEKINPWNIMYFWGDWQVVIAIDTKLLNEFIKIAANHKIDYTILGRAIKGTPTLYGVQNSKKHKLALLRNENFISSSYNVKISDHVDYMLRTSLYSEGDQKDNSFK